MVELSDRDREILTAISHGMPDHRVIVQFGATVAEIETAMESARERAIKLDDGSSAAIFYERALRRRAENAAASLNARFQALMETSSEAIMVVDGRTGLIREANGHAASLLGYSVEEFKGLSVETLVPEDVRSVHVAYRVGFLTSVRKRQMGYHPPIFAVGRSGDQVELAIALLANQADDDVMVVCSRRDLASIQSDPDHSDSMATL